MFSPCFFNHISVFFTESRQLYLKTSLISLKQPPHLDVAMGSRNDINALPALLILQDAGIVFSCQDKQQVLALPLETNIMPSKEVFEKQVQPVQTLSIIL